ncbi:uncharacterized protein MEPE_04984 [Melanopsichium pennsylvanicum]|uniref:Uncharacterized protein n=2 Tax=Melanopsichium pennsylvanicum TaxID=63383 RepID=A0AAJ4XPS6_9BASI|nr:uncharacterized protein BN887_03086 [Melanopsichium pennsylvanicum 4]SNX86275.1 uncharacterized protein MEPE_04984 [Melanopsichium pennsylvanicum]
MKSFTFILSALVLAGGTTATTMPHFRQERYEVDPSGLMVREGGYKLFCSVTVQQLSIPRACFKADWGVSKNFMYISSKQLDGYISENKTNFVVKVNGTATFQLRHPGHAPVTVSLYDVHNTTFKLDPVTKYKKSHQGKEPPKGCVAVIAFTQRDGSKPDTIPSVNKIHCPGTDEPIDLHIYKDVPQPDFDNSITTSTETYSTPPPSKDNEFDGFP